MDAEEMEGELAMDAEEAIASLEGELLAKMTASTEGERSWLRIVYMLIY